METWCRIGPAGHGVAPRPRAHQAQIQRLVARLEEDPLAAIAPLRHVMGIPGKVIRARLAVPQAPFPSRRPR